MAWDMGAEELLQESIIKVEEIKEEPADSSDDNSKLNCENYVSVKSEPDSIVQILSEREAELKLPISSVLNTKVEADVATEERLHSFDPIVEEGENGLKITDARILLSREHDGSQTESEVLVEGFGLQHKRSKGSWECTICHKLFSLRGNLMRHMGTHHGHKPYKCHVCQKKFSRKHHLSVHMRGHTGEKPFDCASCKKQFTNKKDLAVHIRTHTQEKPYRCSVCLKSFTQKGSLDRHLRIHTGEKPYSCSVCKKNFSDKGYLVRHNPVHTGERPYECSVCKKNFSDKRVLVRHNLVHTGEKPYECSVCQKRFSNKHHLVLHMPRHER